MRDFKKYLSSDPTPGDYSEVHAEMTDFITQKKAEMRQPPPHAQSSTGRAQYGQTHSSSTGNPYTQSSGTGRPGTAGSSSSGAGGGRGGQGPGASSSWGAGKGPHPHATGSSHWKSDQEDFFDKFGRFKVIKLSLLAACFLPFPLIDLCHYLAC